jgi:hypothetical protein
MTSAFNCKSLPPGENEILATEAFERATYLGYGLAQRLAEQVDSLEGPARNPYSIRSLINADIKKDTVDLSLGEAAATIAIALLSVRDVVQLARINSAHDFIAPVLPENERNMWQVGAFNHAIGQIIKHSRGTYYGTGRLVSLIKSFAVERDYINPNSELDNNLLLGNVHDIIMAERYQVVVETALWLNDVIVEEASIASDLQGSDLIIDSPRLCLDVKTTPQAFRRNAVKQGVPERSFHCVSEYGIDHEYDLVLPGSMNHCIWRYYWDPNTSRKRIIVLLDVGQVSSSDAPIYLDPVEFELTGGCLHTAGLFFEQISHEFHDHNRLGRVAVSVK